MKALILVGALLGGVTWLGCSGEAVGEKRSEDVGQNSQAFITRTSATGDRTWGVRIDNGNRDSCNKSSTSQECRFVANLDQVFGFEGREQLIKVCIVPTFPLSEGSGSGGVGPVFEIIDFVDVWVSNMFQSAQGATIAWSFSRVNPPGMGSSCDGSGANIVVRPGVTTPPLTASYGQYATAEFVGCQTLGETGTVNGTYKRCASANINYAPSQITSYTTGQGYTAVQRKNARREALFHSLDSAVGIGAQTSNSAFVSFPTMSTTSKFFLSNEETCRLQKLAATGTAVSPPFMQISTSTCAN